MSQTFLDKMIARKRAEVGERGTTHAFQSLAGKAQQSREGAMRHRLKAALSRTDRVNIIAEIKRASPSRGVINDGIDVGSLAIQYESGGAAAISVLTEPEFFGGSLDDLRAARSAVSIPLLRKDFIVDAGQIYEAAIAGADAVLLIVATLDPAELAGLRHVVENDLGMDALVEVHTQDELNTALSAGATLIGVNNRDLHSLEVSLDVSRELIKEKRPGTLMIAESGFSSQDQLVELAEMGFDGFLIGESLMRSADAEKTLREWIKPKTAVPRIKICGITTLQDALLAVENGADELGFNFYPQSPRYVSPAAAAYIIQKLPAEIGKVGVFVNETVEGIKEISVKTGIDSIQLHGDEDEEFVSLVRSLTGLRVIKAVHVGSGSRPFTNGTSAANAILLDAFSPGARGGTGKVFDWKSARQFNGCTIYLAGGLSPENVAEAIQVVRPYAVDVCSGVESQPGRKDAEKLRDFISAVRGAG